MASVNSFLDISLNSTLDSIAEFPKENLIELELQEYEKNHATNGLVEKIMFCYLKHNLTLVCLEDFMKILNECREDCEKFPEHKKQIIKLFRKHRDLFDVFYFVTCEKCKVNTKYSDEQSVKCIRCDRVLKTTETNFFVTIPIEQQIIKSVQDNWSYIQTFNTCSDDEDEPSISDAHDGKILKDLLEQYIDSDVNILSLCLNLDGANKFNSNVLSIWPIQFTQNYLPPNIRFQPNNIIVGGFYYNEKKPNCRDYLLPLISEMQQLNARNIRIAIEEVNYVFKPVITHCAIDLPAKSLLQETKQFGSYDGCTYCETPGELIVIEKSKDRTANEKKVNSKKTKAKNNNQKNADKKDKPTTFVRYVETGKSFPLRDEVKTLKTMLAVSKSASTEAVDGIKGVSCMVALEHFNILFSISVEYMHSGLLGVTKRLVNFFCNPKYKDKNFYIVPKKRTQLSNRLLAIKPPSNIVRKPRSLDQRKNFKASEYRSLLLYYLPVCLPGLVPNVYVEHVRLLSAAIYTLLKATIPISEVDHSEKLLDRFVKEHQKLFGKENMVMVIHLLQHFAESVRQLGPLWCHSAFPFEGNIGCLLKMVNGTTDVLHQLSSKYPLLKSLSKKDRLGTVTDNTIFRGKSVNVVEPNLTVVKIDTSETLNFSNMSLCIYKRVKLGKIIYTSLSYTRPKKSIDYFIGLTDETIGMAKFYFEYEGKIYVMIEKFEVIDNIYHITKVQETKTVVMAPIEWIESKYIFMKVGLKKFIVLPPNPYENE